jgi:amylosucrase
MYAVVFSFGGIPLIYMGDELAMRNDPHWREDPAHVGDNRWMHRLPMNWAVELHAGGDARSAAQAHTTVYLRRTRASCPPGPCRTERYREDPHCADA